MTTLTKLTLTGDSENLNAGATKINLLFDNTILGDGTANRNIRMISVAIADGTTASTIKPSATSVFSGDTIAEENNLGKAGDTGNFNLNADGDVLHIEAGAITGNATHVLYAGIYRNSGSNFPYVQGSISSNGIDLTFRGNNDQVYDLTQHTDVGALYVHVLYLTDS